MQTEKQPAEAGPVGIGGDAPQSARGRDYLHAPAGFVVPLLPYLLSFAAGAMVYVVVEELILEMSEGEALQCGDRPVCGRVYGHDGAGCGAGIKEWEDEESEQT